MIARIVFFSIAACLIAAHFLRAGDVIAAELCLAAPALFLVRRRWSQLLLQGLAYGAAALWIETAWRIAVMRQAYGEPWLRAALILAAVAAASALAGFLLRGPALQKRYRCR
jgi:hypothetical protein